MLDRILSLCLVGFGLSSCTVAGSLTRGAVSHSNQTTQDRDGGLQGTRSLRPWGKGYRTYSVLGNALGRQYAHHKVIETLENTASALHEEHGSVIKVAEIGWRKGGRFLPHATHRQGLSVDIITPMRDRESHAVAQLSTNLLNLYGYCWHIDDDSHRVTGLEWDVASDRVPRACPSVELHSNKEVDFDALKRLIEKLDQEARSRGGKIRFVLVDPSFVESLRGVGVPLSTRSWIEHDDHIHVEFSFDIPEA